MFYEDSSQHNSTVNHENQSRILQLNFQNNEKKREHDFNINSFLSFIDLRLLCFQNQTSIEFNLVSIQKRLQAQKYQSAKQRIFYSFIHHSFIDLPKMDEMESTGLPLLTIEWDMMNKTRFFGLSVVHSISLRFLFFGFFFEYLPTYLSFMVCVCVYIYLFV